jgi:hypothetical protein
MLRNEYQRYLTSLYEQGVVKKIPTTKRGWTISIKWLLETELKYLPQYKRTFIEKFVQPLFKRFLVEANCWYQYCELNNNNDSMFKKFPNTYADAYISYAFNWDKGDRDFWSRLHYKWLEMLGEIFKVKF